MELKVIFILHLINQEKWMGSLFYVSTVLGTGERTKNNPMWPCTQSPDILVGEEENTQVDR